MLAMQSKVIDSVTGPRACAWGVVGCCSILPRQLSRPLTVVTTIVPDRSPNPRLKPSFSAHSSSRSLSRGRRRLNTLQRFVNQSFPSKALIRILIPLSVFNFHHARHTRQRRERRRCRRQGQGCTSHRRCITSGDGYRPVNCGDEDHAEGRSHCTGASSSCSPECTGLLSVQPERIYDQIR